MQTATRELPFTFGFQESQFDNAPVPCVSPTWGDFVAVFDQTRSTKRGGYNIVATMAGDDMSHQNPNVARRCKENVQPRRWIAFDMDGDKVNGESVPMTDSRFDEIVSIAQEIGQGLYYETRSSEENNRHARFVYSLDVALPHGSIIALCNYIESLLPRACWDKSVYRGEQPLYLPVTGVDVIEFDGEPINVSAIARRVIDHAPKPKVRIPRVMTRLEADRATETLGCLHQLGLHIKARASGMHDIVCPWGHLHSDGRIEAAYYEPSASNGAVGGFKCMHSHCADRNIGDLLTFIDECAGVRHAA